MRETPIRERAHQDAGSPLWNPKLRRLCGWLIALGPLFLAIPAIQPLLQNRLTIGYDNVLHLWRSFEADRLLDNGIIYSRWFPHMAFGLGYPALLFQPPLSPLLAALFHRVGLDWPLAVNSVFALGTLLSGWSVWLLVHEVYRLILPADERLVAWIEPAALTASVVVMMVPFHAYVNFHRASMAEALAWAFPGVILWGLLRWQLYADRWGGVAASLGLTAMLLTHDVFTYLFLPFIGVLCIATAWARRDWATFWRGILAVGLGLGCATFFWLPSLAERGYVQFDRALSYDYTASFVPLDYLLEPPRVADTSLINPWPPKGMGLLPMLVAGLALFALRWRVVRSQHTGDVDYAHRTWLVWLGTVLIATVAYLWIATPSAAWLWKLLPVLGYLQFPWRFFPPAAIGVAVLAGVGAGWLSRKVAIAGPLLIAVLVLGSLGWFYPHYATLTQPVNLAGMLAYEYETNWIGGTTFAELLPRAVQSIPRGNPLEDELRDEQAPVRLRPEDLPEGATILEATYGINRAQVVVKTPRAFQARYWVFYYPGWRVEVDGHQVPITPSDPEGLITFPIPAGQHTISVRFGETPLRWFADVISVVSLLVLAGVLILARIPKSVTKVGSQARRWHPYTWVCLGVAILLPIAKILIVDRVNTPLRLDNLDGQRLRRVPVMSDVTFNGELRLLGHAALPKTLAADEELRLQLYWQDLIPGGPDYGVGVAVKDAAGLIWNDPRLLPTRWYREPPPAPQWPPDKYATTHFTLRMQPGTPPGTYTVTTSVLDNATQVTYPAQDGSGRGLGTEINLGTIVVTAPRREIADPDVRFETDAAWDGLRLLGYSVDRDIAMPGDPLLISLMWRLDAVPQAACSVQLDLIDADGKVAADYALPAVREDFPVTRWEVGDVWRGQHLLRLPAALESGMYRWQLRACPTSSDNADGILLSALQIDAPERVWQMPSLDAVVDTHFGATVSLAGALLAPRDGVHPGDKLDVTLVWQAADEMENSYRVFLHLVDPQGRLVAQSDGVPDDWRRPTTGWLPGEVVLDRRMLRITEDAIPGTYQLFAGMYTLEDGRLRTPDGKDTALVATIAVAEP